ncbi:MAG: hypothetical protein Q4B56_07815, partial [Erysipelotrichaceae bacterium]|nr:hypothetical protein [Erysipelotrichaceae bacterium]
KESYFRAAALIPEIDKPIKIQMSLSSIVERSLGFAVQKSKLNNKEKLKLDLVLDISYQEYSSEEANKALEWLDEEHQNTEISYSYYLVDLHNAFKQPIGKDCFLFDDEKVLLERTADKNSMLQFVKNHFKGQDDNFGKLV